MKNDYSFSNGPIGLDYILRTKHGICLSRHQLNGCHGDSTCFSYNKLNDTSEFYFEEFTDEQNKLIQQEAHAYYELGGIAQNYGARDRSHSRYSKSGTKLRKQARLHKWENAQE